MASNELRPGEYGGSDSVEADGTTNALRRQPTVFDYAQANQFKIFLPIFPLTEWFVVAANIPTVTLGQADQYTPFVDIAVVGDKLTYDNFTMTFMVDEQFKNYTEMLNWVYNIGFPFSRAGFNKLTRPDFMHRNSQKAVIKKRSATEGNTDLQVEVNDRSLYTDILLTILSSKNNPVANITIYEAFPVSLGGIQYSQQEGDTGYATCDVEFAFTWFDIKEA